MNANIIVEKKTRKKTQSDENRTSIAVHAEDRDRLNELMKSSGFAGSQRDFFKLLVDNYSGTAMFGTNDVKRIEAAARVSGMSFESIIVTGALKYAELLINTITPPSEDGAPVEDEKRKPADYRVHQAVEEIMTANDSAQSLWDKVEITQGVISKVTGCNRASIQRYLSANKARIELHHAKHHIEADHNRRAGNYKKVNKEG